nr:hypothetical protein [Parachlamydia sp. AcF125]
MVEDFIQNYKKISNQKKLPLLHVEIKQGREEFYEAHYYAGTFHIQASDWRTLAFAIHTLKIGAMSGHYADFLGEKKPKFHLRPLWIECDLLTETEQGIAWVIPHYLRENDSQVTTFAKRLISLGYNAIVLGARDQSLPKHAQEFSLEKVCLTLRSLGIKIILKPTFSKREKHLDKKIFLEVIQKKSCFDYLFIENGSVFPCLSTGENERELTSADLALYEVKFLEKLLGNQQGLIYYVPSPNGEVSKAQAEWLPSFCDEVGAHTMIAFSAVSGDPTSDHAHPHPMWNILRKIPYVSATPLIPIINVGNVHQGEGLWPILTLADIDYYYNHCHRHPFAGMVHLVNQLPQPGAILDCSLWAASQPAWSNLSTALLVETWFSAYRPEMEYLKMAEVWKKNQEIATELSLIRSLIREKKRDKISAEGCKALSESLLSRLHYLQEILRNSASKNPHFANYCQYFIRDAKRMVHHFLQCFNVSIGAILKGEDFEPSFWTSIQEGKEQGLRGATQILILDKPNAGAPDSPMNAIYKESRLFS